MHKYVLCGRSILIKVHVSFHSLRLNLVLELFVSQVDYFCALRKILDKLGLINFEIMT